MTFSKLCTTLQTQNCPFKCTTRNKQFRRPPLWLFPFHFSQAECQRSIKMSIQAPRRRPYWTYRRPHAWKWGLLMQTTKAGKESNNLQPRKWPLLLLQEQGLAERRRGVFLIRNYFHAAGSEDRAGHGHERRGKKHVRYGNA